MADDLRDCRTKLTAFSDQVVEALHRVTGQDKSEIVRQWIHERALEEHRRAVMIGRMTANWKGADAAGEGEAAE